MIATTSAGQDAPPDPWTFHGPDGTPRVVRVTPRLVVNGIEAALDSALAGHGLLRCFSYQVAEAVRDGRLSILLPQAEPTPLPVHLVTPEGRLAMPKVRAFVDFALPRLRGGVRATGAAVTTDKPEEHACSSALAGIYFVSPPVGSMAGARRRKCAEAGHARSVRKVG